MKTPNNMKIKL